MNVENYLASHQFPRSPHIFYAFCPLPSLLLLLTVLLGPHQDLWLCDLLFDGWHEQPLNKVVEALAPNILVQFLSLPHQGASLHNTLSTCLRFVQLQSADCCHGYDLGRKETMRLMDAISFIARRTSFISCSVADCRAYSKEFFGMHNFKSSCMM